MGPFGRLESWKWHRKLLKLQQTWPEIAHRFSHRRRQL